MATTNAVKTDEAAYAGGAPPLAHYLLHASKKSGRGAFSMIPEYLRLCRGRGRLTLPEYVQYGVYDPALSREEQDRFITNTLHWPITHQCCDMTWQAATEDKWLCGQILERAGLPTPQTLAVIDRTDRTYPGANKIETAQALRDFALAQDGAPFFGKQNRGICSFGVFMATKGEADRLHFNGKPAQTYGAFFDDFVGDQSYLVQSVETNHPFFEPYTDNLATVRVCLLLTDAGVHIPFTVLKLPGGENIADSFWRPENVACDVDPTTGRIRTARTKTAVGTTDIRTMPGTDRALVGETIPMWKDLIDLAHRCAAIFEPVRYQSMDIAVTADGPVLIEINTGGGFDLPQLASGRGFLTDEVCDFFRSRGYTKV
ncbi:MAG: sugar-transfer associated ATP-grasp domain-containing protein [Pseudomonadota bacterium]